MSKIPTASAKGVPPRTGAIPRPSKTGVGAGGGKPAPGTSKSSIKKCPGPPKEARKQFDIPALSTLRRTTGMQFVFLFMIMTSLISSILKMD